MDKRECHKCVFCGLTFSRVNALNGHMRVHRGEKNKAMQDLIMNLNQHQANQQRVANPSQGRAEVIDLELRLGPSKTELDLELKLLIM